MKDCPLADVVPTAAAQGIGASHVVVSVLAPSSGFAGASKDDNLHLRCIAGLRGGTVRVTVDNISDTLEPGKCLVFDPTFPYDVENTSSEEAWIFTVDVWHPEPTGGDPLAEWTPPVRSSCGVAHAGGNSP